MSAGVKAAPAFFCVRDTHPSRKKGAGAPVETHNRWPHFAGECRWNWPRKQGSTGPTDLRIFAIEWPSEPDSGKNLAGIKIRISDRARFRDLEPNPAPVYEDATDLATNRSELLDERIGLKSTVEIRAAWIAGYKPTDEDLWGLPLLPCGATVKQ